MEVLHEHIPMRRISESSSVEALRTIAAIADDWPAVFALHSSLNTRRGGPNCYPGFTHVVSYPEPGVHRHSVSANNAWAMFDVVTNALRFRADASA